jgi:ornithine cyclodeaminase/alanine dehydrogenase-like protein (mu-crystallin family)
LVAAWNSANRPAAMTAIAVQKLARADSVSIGFIGCGVQARSHFDVLRLVLPDLKEVVACSRSAATWGAFVNAEKRSKPKRWLAGTAGFPLARE